MATSGNTGPQSPLNRNLEKLFDEAQISGELKLANQRLREFPKISVKYNLNDVVYGDLSKNKFTELPVEITHCTSLEKLNLYHNVVRTIPPTIEYLQYLTYLDISRNQLSVLPSNLCKLPLQVLLVNHNRLVSLPEEINQLTGLLELDASCNQLSHLPLQLGDLQHLQALNLRKNLLVELPKELMFLQLVKLDISMNRISTLPVELRFMISLVDLCVEHNPLTTPPAHLCTRGRIHIFKYLEIQAIKEGRKREILDGECRRLPRKPSVLTDNRFNGVDPQRKRYTVDSGYQTCDGVESRWPQEVHEANGHPSVETGAHGFGTRLSNGTDDSKPNNTFQEEDDEQEKEERRRAARKILEQQMSSHEERSPAHIQTYREYKEALRQQRGNVYKSRENSHTPSPDTPPLLSTPQQDLSRPLHLNVSNDETAKSAVKSAQKEAILSYVMSKTSPTARLSSPTARGTTPPFRSPTSEPSATRNPATRLPRQQSPQYQTHPPGHVNGNHTPPQPIVPPPSFTVRREMEKQREEQEQIQHLRQCIESRLKVSLPDDLGSALMDGVVLCHLANHVRPRSVASIHVPSPAVPKLTAPKCRRNVENFIEACRRIGVPEQYLCTRDEPDVQLASLLRTVRALLDLVSQSEVNGPYPSNINVQNNHNNNNDETLANEMPPLMTNNNLDLICKEANDITDLRIRQETFDFILPVLDNSDIHGPHVEESAVENRSFSPTMSYSSDSQGSKQPAVKINCNLVTSRDLWISRFLMAFFIATLAILYLFPIGQ